MIVVILPQLRSGGTEWQTFFLLQALKPHYKLCLWVYVETGADAAARTAFEGLDIPIVYGSGWAAARQAAGKKPRLILSYAINYYLPEILLKLMTGAALITERRNQYHWLKTQRRRVLQETVRNLLTSAVICNSATVAQRVKEMETGLAGKLHVIPNSMNAFTPVPGGRPAMVAVSNIKAGKALDIIARTFAALRENQVGDDVDFAVYGRQDEPDVWTGLPVALVAEIYRGPGRREDIFGPAFALLHLSEAEGFPNAVLEAASAGAVPILSDIPVHRELFADCALFVKTLDETIAAATKLITLRQTAPQAFAELSQRCRTVAARYSLAARSAAYETLIDAHIN